MAKVMGFDHVSVLVANAEISLRFYQRVLGVEVLPRPKLGFSGFWLDVGGGQSIHLMQLPDPYASVTRPGHGGRDRHLALRVTSVHDFMARLSRSGVEFSQSHSGRKAVFFHDPDQNVVELFEPDRQSLSYGKD